MTGHQWVDQGSSGRDVLAVCSECKPQWRDWAVSREHAHALLLDHARNVHGTNSPAYKRMHDRERKKHERAR
jgi:hypothetical protein